MLKRRRPNLDLTLSLARRAPAECLEVEVDKDLHIIPTALTIHVHLKAWTLSDVEILCFKPSPLAPLCQR